MSVAEGTRGSLVSVERAGAHSALKLRMAQRVARLPRRFPVDHGIELRRVAYWTELSGQPQLATGLLGVPRRHRAGASVLWLNGTNPTRSEAPSSGGSSGCWSVRHSRGAATCFSPPTTSASACRTATTPTCTRLRRCMHPLTSSGRSLRIAGTKGSGGAHG